MLVQVKRSQNWLTRYFVNYPLQWRHNGRDNVSNHQPHDCLLNCLFRRRSKKTSKLRVTGLCVGNSPGTGEFPAQMASNAENVSIWWRHHVDGSIRYTVGKTTSHTLIFPLQWLIMSAMASQIPSVSIVYLNVCSGTVQRKHQSSVSLAFVWGIHRWPILQNDVYYYLGNVCKVVLGVKHSWCHGSWRKSRWCQNGPSITVRMTLTVTHIWTRRRIEDTTSARNAWIISCQISLRESANSWSVTGWLSRRRISPQFVLHFFFNSALVKMAFMFKKERLTLPNSLSEMLSTPF